MYTHSGIDTDVINVLVSNIETNNTNLNQILGEFDNVISNLTSNYEGNAATAVCNVLQALKQSSIESITTATSEIADKLKQQVNIALGIDNSLSS